MTQIAPNVAAVCKQRARITLLAAQSGTDTHALHRDDLSSTNFAIR